MDQNLTPPVNMDEKLTPPANNVVKQPQQVLMTLPQAMDEIKKGKRVARVGWENPDYCILTNGWVSIFTIKEGETVRKLHTWSINDGDIESEDWVVVLEG